MVKKYIIFIFTALISPAISAASEQQMVLPATDQQILLKDTPVQLDKPLFDSLKAVPLQKAVTMEDLDQKRFTKLKDIHKAVTSQRKSMLEFEGYVNWMGGTLASYSKYVEAGSFAAGFARLLPVPYAGQAGQFSRFVSHFALSLSNTSVAVKQYLASSQQFLTGVDALGETGKGKESEMAFLTFYADQQLTRDMTDLQLKLSSVSDLSSSALSFLVSLQQYLASTDEYWQKTKSLLVRKDPDKAEKGALAGSIDGLKTRTEEFNKGLNVYGENVGRTLPVIATLVAYDGLRQELESK